MTSTEKYEVICHTPNGREIRRNNATGKYEVQPDRDNYWIECDSASEAMYRYHFAAGDPDARRIAQMIVASWECQWSISETARLGVSEEDVAAAHEYGDLATAIIVEIESICRERS